MNNTQSVVLTKQSNPNQIRSYFEGVMHLADSNEQFPVNLDEVWPLVYAAKNKATRALKEGFIENEDYITVTQNGHGGKFIRVDYHLSLPCLEYFIARKVRPVFEVYRQVFHKVAKPKQLSTIDILELAVKGIRENQQEIAEVRQEVLELKSQTQTRPDFYTVVGFGSLNGYSVNLSLACRIGQKASRICKERGIETDTIPDPRFGTVKMYPKDVLREVFGETV